MNLYIRGMVSVTSAVLKEKVHLVAMSALRIKPCHRLTPTDLAHLTPDRWQSKTLILSTNVDKNLLDTEFSIAICRPAGDKWQSKLDTVSSDFDTRSSIVRAFSIVAYPVCTWRFLSIFYYFYRK